MAQKTALCRISIENSAQVEHILTHLLVVWTENSSLVVMNWIFKREAFFTTIAITFEIINIIKTDVAYSSQFKP